jgi:2-hydroxychromene-2-carboxylate isomerase
VLDIPLVPPPAHPFNPLLALRVCALPDLAPEARRALVDGLFAAVWGGGGGVTDPDAVEAIAARAGVPDAVARAREPDHKQRFRGMVEQALHDGAWGVPTMIVDDELFWGLDSFGHLERFLAGDPRAQIDPARFVALPASAQRS